MEQKTAPGQSDQELEFRLHFNLRLLVHCGELREHHSEYSILLSCQPRLTDFMFCLQSYQGLIIDGSFVY